MKQVEDWFRQEEEGDAKGQAKCSREVVWTHSEMLDLGKGNVMEELDKELASDILLVEGESFDSDGNRGGSDVTQANRLVFKV